jgi:hypothetical protein
MLNFKLKNLKLQEKEGFLKILLNRIIEYTNLLIFFNQLGEYPKCNYQHYLRI